MSVGVVSTVGAAKALSLQASELPAGWTGDGTAGPCIAAGLGTFAPGHYPVPPPAQQADNEKFAQCLGVPLSRVGMLTGSDEPGEPFTYSSSTFTAPAGSSDNPIDMAPSAQSYLAIEKSASVERYDLAAFSRASFLSCYGSVLKGATWTLMKNVAAAGHLSLSLAPPSKQPVPTAASVVAVGYGDQFEFRSSRLRGAITYSTVVLGAGQIEEVLDLQGSSADPFAPRLWTRLITEAEKRLARFAARKLKVT